jgi:hypothetical protein
METHLITDKIESQSCLSGQLAVTLVCARDLVAADSGGTSDPYVITRMETPHGKSDKMKSRVIQKNLNPDWNETFVFSTTDITRSTLYFQVWDWNVLRDEELGKALFDLHNLTEHHKSIEFSLPLTTSAIHPQGILTVRLAFTPLATVSATPSKPKGTKIPNFRIELTKLHYLPGEKVTGNLVYNVTKEHKIRNIRLDFAGKELVLWVISTGKVTVVYTHTVAVAQERVYMIGKEKDKMTLEAKFYCLPFEFSLPTDAPPTFHKQIGNISYELKGTVDIPLKTDKTVSAEIIVHRPVQELLRAPSARTPERHVNQDIEGLSINVSIDKNTFRIGETAVLQFAIDNKSTHKIDEISVKLEQHEDYHVVATKSSHKVTPFSQKIEKNVLPITPGSSWTHGFSLPIPVKDTVISTEGVAKIIIVKHYFVVNVHYGVLKKVQMKIPITLFEQSPPNMY